MAPAKKNTRQGKRRPGTVLISFPAPACVKQQLKNAALARGEENLSALLRKISAQFIARHRAALKTA